MGIVQRLEFKVLLSLITLTILMFLFLFYRKLCEKLQTYMDTTMGPIAQSFSSMRVHVNFVGF